jgi:hypothetical protein
MLKLSFPYEKIKNNSMEKKSQEKKFNQSMEAIERVSVTGL